LCPLDGEKEHKEFMDTIKSHRPQVVAATS
jgi:hypothetical protein